MRTCQLNLKKETKGNFLLTKPEKLETISILITAVDNSLGREVAWRNSIDNTWVCSLLKGGWVVGASSKIFF